MSNINNANTSIFSNINPHFVNVSNTNNPANFSSNEIGTYNNHGHQGLQNNIDAIAASALETNTVLRGGNNVNSDINSDENNNINENYRHAASIYGGMKIFKFKQQIKEYIKKINTLKKKFQCLIYKTPSSISTNIMYNKRKYSHSKKYRGGTNKRYKHKKHPRKSRRNLRGGYSQYQNNLPMTPTFSVGGPLAPSMSALANPPPIQSLTNCTNCVDNYSHFTNLGFPSRGH